MATQQVFSKVTIKAGTPCTVIKPNGQAVSHQLKETITLQPDQVSRTQDNPLSDHPDTWANFQYMGYTVICDWYATEWDRICQCSGKGIIDEIMYGPYKGHRMRVKCCPSCSYRKSK
jgi:hypothetical protein